MDKTTTIKQSTPPATLLKEPRWMTVAECLDELGIPRSTWEKWRQRDVAPRAKKLPNGSLRVRRDWLDDWMFDLPELP